MSKTLFTIKTKKENPVPAYMDMTIFKPRRYKIFKNGKEYKRREKYKQDFLSEE